MIYVFLAMFSRVWDTSTSFCLLTFGLSTTQQSIRHRGRPSQMSFTKFPFQSPRGSIVDYWVLPVSLQMVKRCLWRFIGRAELLISSLHGTGRNSWEKGENARPPSLRDVAYIGEFFFLLGGPVDTRSGCVFFSRHSDPCGSIATDYMAFFFPNRCHTLRCPLVRLCCVT